MAFRYNSLLRSISLVTLLILLSGLAMAFGKSFVLCSPFAGTVVTDGGKPAAGIEVERHWVWAWNDQSGTDKTVSDENGKFEFPIVKGSSFFGAFLPHEPNITTGIAWFVHYPFTFSKFIMHNSMMATKATLFSKIFYQFSSCYTRFFNFIFCLLGHWKFLI